MSSITSNSPSSDAPAEKDFGRYSPEIFADRLARLQQNHNPDAVIADLQDVLRKRDGGESADKEGVSKYYSGWSRDQIQKLLEDLEAEGPHEE